MATLVIMSSSVRAADIEPRSYSNIPVGVNFLIAGYSYTQGNVSFAPSVPIENGKMEIHSSVFAYVRSLDLWGKSGKVDIIIPQAWMSGKADFLGQPRPRQTSGFTDPLFRLYVNLFGAPALSMKEFASYQQDTIIGASLAVIPPGGRYESQKIVNIGTHRWAIKPEIGISKAWGAWTAEFAAGVFVFTDNDAQFVPVSPKQGVNVQLQQSPLYNFQGHLIYSFGHGMWGAIDANYYTGARTTLNDKVTDTLQQNWRVGGTLSFSVNRQNSIKIFGNTVVHARTGSFFDTIGIAWQYRWGEGF
ncbi:transporter [Methylomicrobium lacus]|uniref:transporter n=1 Tax=Methylomicrobium lacus TaxID=136992 RepID=UPI0035A95FC0